MFVKGKALPRKQYDVYTWHWWIVQANNGHLVADPWPWMTLDKTQLIVFVLAEYMSVASVFIAEWEQENGVHSKWEESLPEAILSHPEMDCFGNN